MSKYFAYLCRTLLPAVSMFLLFSIPSLKLIHSSNIINLGVSGLLFVSLIVNYKSNLRKFRSLCFVILFFYFFIKTIQLLNSADILVNPIGYLSFGLLELIDFVYLLIIFFIIAYLANLDRLRMAGVLIFFWGIILAVWQLSVGIPTDRDLGQHYLTISMPVGAALAYSLSIAFCCSIKVWKRLFYVAAGLLLFFAIASLLSRSGMIFPLVVVFFFIVGSMVFNKGMKLSNKIFVLLFIGIILVLFFVFIVPTVEFQQLDRLMRIAENISDEPRIRLYMEAMDLILQRPIFGYGTGSAFGHYYHNIFLDILVMGGLVLFVPFFIFVVSYFCCLKNILKYKLHDSKLIGFAAASLMLFMQFNTSFSFRNAYISVGAMVLLCLAVYDFKCTRLSNSFRLIVK